MTGAAFAAAAGAVIFDDAGRVLLCHRTDHDLWNLPSGGVEPGEAPWDAAVRETLEEVGLEVACERLTGVYLKPDVGELVFVFRCRIVGGEPRLTDEADAVDWFPTDGLPANLSPRQAERIADAVVDGAPTVWRTQSGPGARELIDRGGIGGSD